MLTWVLDAAGDPFVYEKMPDGTSLHIGVCWEAAEDSVPVEIAPGVIQHGGDDASDGWVADGTMFHGNGRLSMRIRSPVYDSAVEAKQAAESIWEDLRHAAVTVPSTIGLPRSAATILAHVPDDDVEAAAASAPSAPDNVVPFVGDVEVVSRFAAVLVDVVAQVSDDVIVYGIQRFSMLDVEPEDLVGAFALLTDDPGRAAWTGSNLDPALFARLEAMVARIKRLQAVAGNPQ